MKTRQRLIFSLSIISGQIHSQKTWSYKAALIFCAIILFHNLSFVKRVNAHTNNIKIYAVISSSQIDDYLDPLLDLNFIEGITLYIGHKIIEPKYQKIQTCLLNSFLERCRLKNKKVKIGILFGQWTPEWVYGKNVAKVCCNKKYRNYSPGIRKLCFPQSWGPNYLEILGRFLEEFGRLYGGNPLIHSIQITGPSPVNGLETNWDACMESGDSEKIKATIVEAWKFTIKKYIQFFKTQDLTIALHDQFFGKRDDSPAIQIKNYLYQMAKNKGRIMICYLTYQGWFKKSNRSVSLWSEDIQFMNKDLQMIDIFSRKDISPFLFRKVLIKAKQFGSSRVEIFAQDCLNQSYHDSIKAIIKE